MDPGGVAGGESHRHLGRHTAEGRRPRDGAQHAERHNTGPRRRVGSNEHAVESPALCGERDDLTACLDVAVVDHLYGRIGLVDDPCHVAQRRRRRSAIDVPSHVRADGEDEVGADDPTPRDRRPAGVDDHLHAVSLGPADHGLSLRRILHPRYPDLPHEPHTSVRHLGKVILGEPGFEQYRPGDHLGPAWAHRLERSRRQDGECFDPCPVGWPARGVGFAGGDHGGYPPWA